MLVLFAVLTYRFFASSDCTFDRQKWLSVQIQSDSDLNANKSEPRKCMVSDIANRLLRKGMAKSEVIKLLGFDDMREFYDDKEAADLFGIVFPLGEDHDKNNVGDQSVNKTYNESDVSVSQNEKDSYVDLRYDVGQNFVDYCTLNIRFDKHEKLIAIFYYCD